MTWKYQCYLVHVGTIIDVLYLVNCIIYQYLESNIVYGGKGSWRRIPPNDLGWWNIQQAWPRVPRPLRHPRLKNYSLTLMATKVYVWESLAPLCTASEDRSTWVREGLVWGASLPTSLLPEAGSSLPDTRQVGRDVARLPRGMKY